jgi:hypothetical protein
VRLAQTTVRARAKKQMTDSQLEKESPAEQRTTTKRKRIKKIRETKQNRKNAAQKKKKRSKGR